MPRETSAEVLDLNTGKRVRMVSHGFRNDQVTVEFTAGALGLDVLMRVNAAELLARLTELTAKAP